MPDLSEVTNMEDLKYVDFPVVLPLLEEKSRQLQFGMPSEPLLGALLRVLAASRPGGRFLELGTGTGIATTWLLDGMDVHATLMSVDVDETMQRVACEVLGHDQRLTLLVQDGVRFLKGQQARSFDLVFADAIPGKYEALEDALAVVKVGGFYVIDDMLPQANWPTGHAEKVPVLIERLASCSEFILLPLVWASGVVVAVRKQ
jgi:predicted O-methyltransferase YrrM